VADRTFTLLRHGQSTYNVRGILNGDPSVDVRLTDVGRGQCREARRRLEGVPLDLAIHTGFPRTVESLEIITGDRDLPVVVYPEMGDVRLGDFEGERADAYWVWRHARDHSARPPGGGESRLDVLARFVDGYERMLGEPADHVIAVMHDVPIRFLQNALNDDDPLDGPILGVTNATPFTVDDDALRRGVDVMRERTRRP